MDVIINSENSTIPKEAELFFSEKESLLNLLMVLGYDPLNPPIAEVLSLYHKLQGDWLILSPIHWQATHKDAMISATAKELQLDAKTFQYWFDLYAAYLKEEHVILYYHDAHTWLLQSLNKPPLKAKPVHRLLNCPLMPELEQLDSSLYWQRFFTEGQMFFASHPNDSQLNGAWLWGGASLEEKKDRSICADETWFKLASICSDDVTLYNPTLKLKQYSILCLNDFDVLSVAHQKELEKISVRWYWNNIAYMMKPKWFTRFWRKLTYAY